MTPERWQQIQNLFDQVRNVESNERAAFLQQACAGDEELRREVEWMLTHQNAAEDFMRAPALDEAAISLAADTGTSLVGFALGPYQELELIGAGGMGEVYSARDIRLDRRVAIKRLHKAFVNDRERIARLEREAKLLATLNHPNIAAIYELDEYDGLQYLVMELASGLTLAERLSAGPMKCEEALRIGVQIAEAVAAAHEKGIIHRDLKPANIKITAEGNVKVLDFGLAKVFSEDVANINLPQSAAMTNGGTQRGSILGTPAYMSPEQAQGKALDRRTDIWSFGCVVYEMLTGRRVFAGDTVTDTFAAILKNEPDWTLLPSETPEIVKVLLRKCLNKDKQRRLHDIADWQVFADEAASQAPPHTVNSSISSHRNRWFVALTLVPLLLAVGFAVAYLSRAPREGREVRLEISTPATSAPFEFSLSPDGRYIVFVASGDGPRRLWLRALDKTDAQPMAGTEGADYPFWSPDSRSIGFTAAGKLKRIDIAGGLPQELANSSVIRSGAWNSDGTILFSARFGPLSRVTAAGGEPVAVTRLDPRQTQHRHPRFFPDGRHFLFYVDGTPEAAGIYLGSIDGGEPKRLTASDTVGAYFGPGMIAFVRQTSLIAQHVDLKRGELIGDPVKLVDGVGSSALGVGGFSLSGDGTLAYRSSRVTSLQLTWYDRAGKAAGVAGDPIATLLYPELSPDSRRVALQRSVQANNDVWLMDLVRGGMTRFTVRGGGPIWSPNGMQVAFTSAAGGLGNLYVKPSSGAGAEESLRQTENNLFAQDWSKDGRFLLYGEISSKTGRDLWALPMTGNDRAPIRVVNTPSEELNGQFHPDGSWVAYETNESGRFEIVLQPFPDPTVKRPVSIGGGIQPRWRADGKELYFIAPDGKLMAAAITGSGPTLAAGTPAALFPVALAPGAGANKQQYMVSPDGRFLINQPVETSTATPITLILNWKPNL